MNVKKPKRVKVIDVDKFVAKTLRLNPFVEFVGATTDALLCSQIVSSADAASLCLADDTAAWLCGRISDCNYATFRIASERFDQKKARSVLLELGWEESYEQILLGGSWKHLVYTNVKAFAMVPLRLVVWRGRGDVTQSNPCPQFSYFVKITSSQITTAPLFLLMLNTQKTINSQINDKINVSLDINDDDDDDDTNNVNRLNCIRKKYFVSNLFIDNNDNADAIVVSRDCDCLRRVAKDNVNADDDDNANTTQYVNLVFDLEQRDDTNTYHKMFILQEDLIEEPYDDNTIKLVCSCYL
ncbi:LEF12 [Orgyia pseudotsugata single capsid nuclopolyhedrovirus]|nr:LEF12 [Orgyia pseudotsugata single capsid nuclopolyhedrovirus]